MASVRLGATPAGGSEEGVPFQEIELVDGRFSGRVPLPPAAAEHDAIVRVCLGERCAATRASVSA